MREKLKDLPEPTHNAALEAERLTVAWTEFRVELGRLAETRIVEILIAMTDAVVWMKNAIDPAAEAIGKFIDNYNRLDTAFQNKDFKNIPGLGWLVDADEWVKKNVPGSTILDDFFEARKQEFLDWKTKFWDEPELKAVIGKKAPSSELTKLVDPFKGTASRLEETRRMMELRLEQAERLAKWMKDLSLVSPKDRPELKLVSEGEMDQELEAYVDFLQQIERLEADASGDRVRMIATEYDLREVALRNYAVEVGASEGELVRVLAASEKKKTADIKGELKLRSDEIERARKKAEQDEVRRVLLVFHADAGNVREKSDLVAFSLGILVDQFRNLDPAISTAITGIEQVVFGMMKGGPGGMASAITGGLAIVSAGLSIFQRRAQEAEKERRRLTQAIQDAADVEGRFADQLAGVPGLTWNVSLGRRSANFGTF